MLVRLRVFGEHGGHERVPMRVVGVCVVRVGRDARPMTRAQLRLFSQLADCHLPVTFGRCRGSAPFTATRFPRLHEALGRARVRHNDCVRRTPICQDIAAMGLSVEQQAIPNSTSVTTLCGN